jgi:hypothetical protein
MTPTYQISRNELNSLMLGLFRAMRHEFGVVQGQASPFLSEREAKRIFGATRINGWTDAGLIKPIIQGKGKKRLFRHSELIALDEAGKVVIYANKF